MHVLSEIIGRVDNRHHSDAGRCGPPALIRFLFL